MDHRGRTCSGQDGDKRRQPARRSSVHAGATLLVQRLDKNPGTRASHDVAHRLKKLDFRRDSSELLNLPVSRRIVTAQPNPGLQPGTSSVTARKDRVQRLDSREVDRYCLPKREAPGSSLQAQRRRTSILPPGRSEASAQRVLRIRRISGVQRGLSDALPSCLTKGVRASNYCSDRLNITESVCFGSSWRSTEESNFPRLCSPGAPSRGQSNAQTTNSKCTCGKCSARTRGPSSTRRRLGTCAPSTRSASVWNLRHSPACS